MKYSEKEIKRITELAEFCNVDEAAEIINNEFGTNRTPGALQKFGCTIGAHFQHKKKSNAWTPEENNFLEINAIEMTLAELSQFLFDVFNSKRTQEAIRMQCARLGLKAKIRAKLKESIAHRSGFGYIKLSPGCGRDNEKRRQIEFKSNY